MILTKQAIKALEKDEKLRRTLAVELNILDVTFEKWLKSNDDNSRLTTYAIVKLIETETGLKESEILTSEKFA